MTAKITTYLDRVQALTDAATEGPWVWHSRITADGDQWAVFDPSDWALASNRDGWAPDAEFIAAARTDMGVMERMLRRVGEIHSPTGDSRCAECVTPYPCRTVQVILEGLHGKD